MLIDLYIKSTRLSLRDVNKCPPAQWGKIKNVVHFIFFFKLKDDYDFLNFS